MSSALNTIIPKILGIMPRDVSNQATQNLLTLHLILHGRSILDYYFLDY